MKEQKERKRVTFTVVISRFTVFQPSMSHVCIAFWYIDATVGGENVIFLCDC